MEETRKPFKWKPNAADLDIVQVACECGNTYDIPRDVVCMMNDECSFCGHCGETGKMSVVADPSAHKVAVLGGTEHDAR